MLRMSRRRVASAVRVLATFTATGLAGCWTQPSTLGLPCVTDSECDAGQWCSDGRCGDGSGSTGQTEGPSTSSMVSSTTSATTGASATTSSPAGSSTTTLGTEGSTSEAVTGGSAGTTGAPVECARLDCAPAPQWSVAYGDAQILNKALDVDGAGNIYVGGSFKDSLSVEGFPTLLGVENLFSMYVIKFAPSGVPAGLWGFGADGSGGDELLDLAVTDEGVIYFTGYYTGPQDMCDKTLPGFPNRQDLFVARINTAGVCDAIANYPADGTQRGFALDYLESQQRLALAGAYQGNLNLGVGPLMTEQLGGVQGNGLLALYSDELAVLWATEFGEFATYESVDTVRFGPGGALLIAGTFTDTITLKRPYMSLGGTDDVFLARANQADGTLAWATALISEGGVGVAAIDYDPESGAIVIGGSFKSKIASLELDSGSLDNRDLFVASLDSGSGELNWAERFGGANVDEELRGLVIDPVAGHVLLSARCAPGTDFGGGALAVMGNTDACLARLRLTTGELLWSDRFGGGAGALPETGRQLAIDLNDDPRALLWTGDFYGTASFVGPELTADGVDARAFLVRFGL